MNLPLKTRKYVGRLPAFVVLGGILVFTLIPLFWTISTSLKLPPDISTVPPEWLPRRVTIINYMRAIGTRLPGYFVNSLIVSFGSVIAILVMATPAGYAAARLDFPGKRIILFLLLISMMVPGVVIIVPLYVLLVETAMINTFRGLILVYSAWRVPFALWILRGFFEGIAKDLEDAAMIDGCTRVGAFFRVILPLTRPGIAAAGIGVFIYCWNEFILALTLLSQRRVVTAGFYYFVTGVRIEWGPLTASLIMVLAPLLLFFFLLERHFVAGLTAGAIKD